MGKAKDVAEEDEEFTTIGITVEARDLLARLCRKRNGSNVREVSSAIVRWFVEQKPFFQTAILDVVDEGMERHYAGKSGI